MHACALLTSDRSYSSPYYSYCRVFNIFTTPCIRTRCSPKNRFAFRFIFQISNTMELRIHNTWYNACLHVALHVDGWLAAISLSFNLLQ